MPEPVSHALGQRIGLMQMLAAEGEDRLQLQLRLEAVRLSPLGTRQRDQVAQILTKTDIAVSLSGASGSVSVIRWRRASSANGKSVASFWCGRRVSHGARRSSIARGKTAIARRPPCINRNGCRPS